MTSESNADEGELRKLECRPTSWKILENAPYWGV
jgi:hypothetical protein